MTSPPPRVTSSPPHGTSRADRGVTPPPRVTSRGARLTSRAARVTSSPPRVTSSPPRSPDPAEARRRFRVSRFIMEAGVRLGLGSAALGTALGAFQGFSRAARAPHDPLLVAAAALLLASKAQGAGPRARDVINVTHRCLHPGEPPPGPGAALGLRQSLGRCELLLLRALRFRLPAPQPHKYLLQYLLALGRWGRRGGWGQPLVPGVSWALLRDGAAGGLGLRHPPQHLAAAVLLLAMAICGTGPPPGAPPRWWQVLSPSLGPSELAEILRGLLELYGTDSAAGGCGRA